MRILETDDFHSHFGTEPAYWQHTTNNCHSNRVTQVQLAFSETRSTN